MRPAPVFRRRRSARTGIAVLRPLFTPPGSGEQPGKAPLRRGAFLLGAYEDRGEFRMRRALLAGKNLAKHEDFLAVLFFSLIGLDLSLWLASRGFFDSI